MKIKKLVPLFLTYTNLAIGILIILINFYKLEKFKLIIFSSILIIIAAFIDRYDGLLARMFGVESDFGREIDSFADLITFGVAPMVLIWNIYLVNFYILGILPIFLYIFASVFRLARYNILGNVVFKGIPITFAGSFIALFNIITHLFFKREFLIRYYPPVINIIILILAIAMISKFHFANTYFRWEENVFKKNNKEA